MPKTLDRVITGFRVDFLKLVKFSPFTFNKLIFIIYIFAVFGSIS